MEPAIGMHYRAFDLQMKRYANVAAGESVPMSRKQPQNDLIIHHGKKFKAKKLLSFDVDHCRDHNNGLPKLIHLITFFSRVSFVKNHDWSNCDHPH